MDLSSAKTIKELLSKYQAKPSKVMGQNFLIDKPALIKMVDAAELNQDDVVVEVGPGLGTLTQELAQKAKRVIAIEKDPAMIQILEETLRDYQNVQILTANALDFNPQDYRLENGNYKLVANIPYYLTSPLIRKFLEQPIQPIAILIMIQKEVAQRICARPPDMSLLAVSVQFYAQPKIISYISKGCFLPVPKVDSAIIKIIPLKNEREINPEYFFKIVKAGFSSPRKQLINNLATSLKKDKKEVGEWLEKSGIDPMRRSETLSIDDWMRLAS